MKIFEQKQGKLNDADRQTLATILFKAGYTVRICKEVQGKINRIGVEYIGDKEIIEN